jgi:hypothetical protein
MRNTITKYKLKEVEFDMKDERKLNALILKLYDLPLDTINYKAYKLDAVSKTKIISQELFNQNIEKYKDLDVKAVRLSIEQYEKLLIKIAKQTNQVITNDMMLELMHNNLSEVKNHYFVLAEEIELVVIF